MDFNKTLILTYKPAVEDAWKKDLEYHIDFKDYLFSSSNVLLLNDALQPSTVNRVPKKTGRSFCLKINI